MWRLGDRCPHLLQILLPCCFELLKGSLSHVTKHEQQDSLALVWRRCEELQIDLRFGRMVETGTALDPSTGLQTVHVQSMIVYIQSMIV